jgi:cell division transport system permease protein
METELQKPAPIFPPRAAPLASLTVTMAVMCYLASLAIGAIILINHAVENWTHGLSREVTVQLRHISDVDPALQLAESLRILTSTQGVVNAAPLDRDASLKLLEPWLGKISGEDLPIPQLIRVTLDEATPPDFAILEQNLGAAVKGVSLDTHQRWESELTRTASMLSNLGYGVLALIILASVMLVIFASRAVLEANRQVVGVLELIGAKNSFVARLNDWQFLKTGMMAGCVGAVAALLTFYALSATGETFAAAGQALVFAPKGLQISNLLAFAAVPIVATLIAVITSRLTLAHMLGQSR